MPTFLLAAILLTSARTTLIAQDQLASLPKPPLPPGPIFLAMSDFSRWQIDFTYPDDAAKPAASPAGLSPQATLPPRQIVITRTLPLWHVVLTDTGGSSAQCWCDGATHFVQLPGQAAATIMPPEMAATLPLLMAYDKTNFPDVAWVSPSTYLGVQAVSGSPCFVFRDGSGESAPTVWVNSATHYPVRWQSGGEVRFIQMLPAPSNRITFPADIAKIDDFLRNMQTMAARPIPRGD